jgi:hypothetical protein
MIKQKKTKKKNVNVNQTVVVNIQKGKRNPRAKASAPQAMPAPQIIQPQVGSAYHQAVYGGRAGTIPAMGGVPGYYGGMMSPFNAPLHIASEVQQAQLRQMNELAAANVARPVDLQQKAERRPVSRLVEELNPLQVAPQQAPLQVVEEKRKPIRVSFYPGSYDELKPVEQPSPVKPKPMRYSFYPGSYEELPISSIGVSEVQPSMSSLPISLAPQPIGISLSMQAPETPRRPPIYTPELAASAASSSMLSPEEATRPPAEMNDKVLGVKITQQSLNELPYKRKDRNDTRVFLTDIASARGIPLPRTVVGKKADVINYLIQQINK